jgi:hypothetical protein
MKPLHVPKKRDEEEDSSWLLWLMGGNDKKPNQKAEEDGGGSFRHGKRPKIPRRKKLAFGRKHKKPPGANGKSVKKPGNIIQGRTAGTGARLATEGREAASMARGAKQAGAAMREAAVGARALAGGARLMAVGGSLLAGVGMFAGAVAIGTVAGIAVPAIAVGVIAAGIVAYSTGDGGKAMKAGGKWALEMAVPKEAREAFGQGKILHGLDTTFGISAMKDMAVAAVNYAGVAAQGAYALGSMALRDPARAANVIAKGAEAALIIGSDVVSVGEKIATNKDVRSSTIGVVSDALTGEDTGKMQAFALAARQDGALTAQLTHLGGQAFGAVKRSPTMMAALTSSMPSVSMLSGNNDNEMATGPDRPGQKGPFAQVLAA